MGRAAAPARLQQRLQLRVGGDRIERIGIQHQRARLQRLGQRGAHRLAAAAAAGHRHGARGPGCPRGAPSGPVAADRAPAPRIEEADEHAAGAVVQRPRARPAARPRPCRVRRRSRRRRHSCPCGWHAAAPAAGRRRERGPWAARRRQGDLQVVEPDLARGVASLGGEQAGLEGEQAERVRGAHRQPAPGRYRHPAPRAGPPRAAARRRHSAARCAAPARLRGARAADAQQGVDREVVLVRRLAATKRTPAARTLQRGLRVGGRMRFIPSQVTSGSLPHCFRCIAASKPSPPLLPGPQATQIVRACGASASASRATARPARCISVCGAGRRLRAARGGGWPRCRTGARARSGVTRCMGPIVPRPVLSLRPGVRRPGLRGPPPVRAPTSGRPPRGRCRRRAPSRSSRGRC